MPYNPKSLLNLKQCKKGQAPKHGAGPGRPPSLAKMIGAIPKDAQTRVYEVLHHALALPNVKEAKKYLESDQVQEGLAEYGFLLQIAVKSLMSKTGWLTAVDILDRLFGKPRQAIQADFSLDLDEAPVIVFRAGEEQPQREEG